MKKVLVFMIAAIVLSSCAVTRSGLETASVQAPVISTTMASLDVEKAPITHVYVPTKAERKALSFNQLLANAQYAAQKAHGSGDVMVNVSYMVDGKKFLAKTKVKKITVTGYPARYVDFRTPTEEDRKNVEAFYNAGKLIELQDANTNNTLPIIIKRKK